MKLDNNTIYLYNPYGYGDVFIICSMLKSLENKYSSKICLIIQEKHIIVMDIFNIAEYIVVKSDMEFISFYRQQVSNKPERGKVYICHPNYHPERNVSTNNSTFIEMYQKLFEIQHKPQFPNYNIDKFRDNKIITDIESIMECDIDNIILIVPCAKTIRLSNNSIWYDLVYEIKSNNKGSKIISDQYISDEIPHFCINFNQLVGLCSAVKNVYALRSGLCDIINTIGNKLHVLYPDKNTLYSYSLNTLYNRNDIDEIII